MRVGDTHFRSIWPAEDGLLVRIIDQRQLPHRFVIEELRRPDDFLAAIRDMHVRGAGLIGATAGFAMAHFANTVPENDFAAGMADFALKLCATRPTAANLAWAVARQQAAMEKAGDVSARRAAANKEAQRIADEDAAACHMIGHHGLPLIESIHRHKQGKAVNILTHCNAGWLAFVDYGSATAPIYEAHRRGIPLHVWVDETRPWNQGARLTAWELAQEGVPHTLIVDNTGGHLMQHGLVDMVVTGADRVTRRGDAANKIGTYLKALAAWDNAVPFYVALPSSTIDWELEDGISQIPIEERSAAEILSVEGLGHDGKKASVLIAPPGTRAANFAFDVTPARLITGLITERGIAPSGGEGLAALFPERA